MSTTITLTSEPGLRTTVLHPSGATLQTVASADHGGDGDGFSPTDLLSASLGSCILTIVGMIAARKGLDITGARVTVLKQMDAYGTRIVALETNVHIPGELALADRQRLERGAASCPVHHALDPAIEAPIRFSFGQC